MDSQLLELLVNTNIDFNAITKKGILLKAVQAKIDNPKETKQNIANNLNVSTRTLQRYANEYNFNDFKKQKKKQHLILLNVIIVNLFLKAFQGLNHMKELNI